MKSAVATTWSREPTTQNGARKRAEPGQAPLSLIAARIVQEAVGEDVSVADLSRLAMSDPGFAARVVTIVNSAAYGQRRAVTDVRQACSLLGVRGLRNVALALVVSDMVPTGDDGTVLLTTSLRRAVASRLIAETLGSSYVDDAFTVGLFLEIGTLALARTDVAGAANVARMPAAHRLVVERAFGYDEHPAAGAALGEKMKLAPGVVEAIARHHDAVVPSSELAKIAWAAERVAGAWECGDVEGIRQDAVKALTAVGVSEAAVEGLLRSIPELVTAAAGTFNRPIDAQTDLEDLARDANARLVELNFGYEQLVRRMEALLREKQVLADELKAANAELTSLATTDALTGLPNKRYLVDALARDVARADRAGTSLAVVMLDVDHFKKFNDTWGHRTGDLVLAAVGAVLKRSVRVGDIPARYGGEEFTAILPGADPEGARVVAERIRAALEATEVAGPKGPLKVTASFGVAIVKGPNCQGAAETLVARADAALYEAKRAGRNCVVVAT